MKLYIEAMRTRRGLSQKELASMAGVSQRTVGNWERGSTIPNAEQLWSVAVALDTDINELVGWYEKHPEDRPLSRLSPDESTLLADYRASDEPMKAAARAVAREGASREAKVVQVDVSKGA